MRARGRLLYLGAGDLGKLAHVALQTRQIAVSHFCDGGSRKNRTSGRGAGVLSPDQLASLPRNSYVFIAANYLQPALLGRAVQDALGDGPRASCRALGQRLRSTGGAREAAARIVELASLGSAS